MKFEPKEIIIPDLEISEEEYKPFKMWFLNTKARKEINLTWRFFDLWKGVKNVFKIKKNKNNI